MHMKFAHARTVSQDVPALVLFYRQLTGMTPVGDGRYTELHGPLSVLAISSQRMIDLRSAGAATSRSNRSMILDFEVADVDEEHGRLHSFVNKFVLEPTTQPWGNRSVLFRDPDG